MKHKILLVDDQDEIRSLLSDSFRVRGYDVMEAADAAGLKAALTGPQPDVVLLFEEPLHARVQRKGHPC